MFQKQRPSTRAVIVAWFRSYHCYQKRSMLKRYKSLSIFSILNDFMEENAQPTAFLVKALNYTITQHFIRSLLWIRHTKSERSKGGRMKPQNQSINLKSLYCLLLPSTSIPSQIMSSGVLLSPFIISVALVSHSTSLNLVKLW